MLLIRPVILTWECSPVTMGGPNLLPDEQVIGPSCKSLVWNITSITVANQIEVCLHPILLPLYIVNHFLIAFYVKQSYLAKPFFLTICYYSHSMDYIDLAPAPPFITSTWDSTLCEKLHLLQIASGGSLISLSLKTFWLHAPVVPAALVNEKTPHSAPCGASWHLSFIFSWPMYFNVFTFHLVQQPHSISYQNMYEEIVYLYSVT